MLFFSLILGFLAFSSGVAAQGFPLTGDPVASSASFDRIVSQLMVK